jgi:trk system potassium uptake protein TrkH
VIDFRPVLFVNGCLLLILAASMGVPAIAGMAAENGDSRVFVAAGGIVGLAGGALLLGSQGQASRRLDTRQAFLLTVSGWVLAALGAALPFKFSSLGLSFTDAVFEAMSGLTTTGATVIVGLDQAPTGILLWRAMLQWLGGAGIIVMAVAVLPLLRIGGMQLFKMESSDTSERLRPRVLTVAASVAAVYLAFSLLSASAFWLAGMSAFDAVCHAMAAVSTGGFSTSDESLGHWGATAQWVAVASMAAGGAPLPLFVRPWRHGARPLLEDAQLRAYLRLLGGLALVVGIWRWATSDSGLWESLRQSAFAVVSMTTTTGFVATDWSGWGGFAHVVFFLLVFVGGCTGSPSGAIKVFRWQALFALAEMHIERLLHPHGVFVVEFERRRLTASVTNSVLAFVVLYIVTFAVHALALAATGLDLVTALSGSAAALGNAGRGLGEVIGPDGSFAPLPAAAKWILSFEMLVGRLELFTLFVLFTPDFWRD